MSNKQNTSIPYKTQTRLTLLAAVGGYLLYLAYGVLRDGKNGVSGLSWEVNLCCAAFLALGGIATLAWTCHCFRKAKAPRD